MLLLAIDTSTSAITVAVHDGEQVVAFAEVIDKVGHAEHLAPLIATCLGRIGAEPGALTDVVCGRGPGPFTGLRVGIVTARVLALAVGARLHGVVSLDALACAAGRSHPDREILVATDARRKEVYWARYAASGPAAETPDGGRLPQRIAGPAVNRPDDLVALLADRPHAVVVGRGLVLYPALGALADPATLAEPALLDVSAAALADLAARALAEHVDLSDTEPLYLRRPDAQPQPVSPVPAGTVGPPG